MKSVFASTPLLALAALTLASLIFSIGCDAKPNTQAGAGADLSGRIRVEGSSTVQPISNKGKELFNEKFPNVNIAVGGEGTGNGFKAMAKGECDFSGASRPIKKKELNSVSESGIKFVEVPVAYDGLTIVVNNENDFVNSLNVEQLKQIFREDLAAKTWKDVDPSWPDEAISLYIPGAASGTFDYFSEVVCEKEGPALRSDSQVQTSEDDKTLVTGVKGEKFAIGFFGYSYYIANRDELKVVPITNPDTNENVTPSIETIKSGEYAPFSRPLFIYVNAESYKKLQVQEYLEFFFDRHAEIVEASGYVPLPQSVIDAARDNLEQGKTGTHYVDDAGEKREGALESVFVPANLLSQE